MHRIDGPGHASNLFTEGNPAGGVPATTVTDDWLNDVQEELANLVEAAGLTLVKGNQDQLRQALYYLAGETNAHGKNQLINSAFDWWERASSPQAGVNSDGYKGPDRWYIRPGGGGVVTLTKEEISPFASGPEIGGAGRYLSWEQTTGGTGPELEQRVPGVNSFDGVTYTFSFWAKVDSGTLVVTPRIRQFWGTTGSAESETSFPTITITTTWQRFNVVMAIPSGSGKTATGTGQYTGVTLLFPDSTTFKVHFGWPNFTRGPYATPYQRHPSHVEFARVHRFYRKTYSPGFDPGSTNDAGTQLVTHGGLNARVYDMQQAFDLPMRATPVMTYYSPDTGTANRVHDPNGSGDKTVVQQHFANRLSTGYPRLSSNPGAIILQAHWTAEAEL